MTTHLIAKLHDEFIEDGYMAQASDTRHYPLPKYIPEILKKHNLKQKHFSILDLGCGPGNLKSYTSYESYTGVDVSRSMLRHAKKAGYNHLAKSDIISYIHSHSEQQFDGIFCLSVTYFMSPDELQKLLTFLQKNARKFWIITLDGITPELIRLFQKERGITLYNHTGLSIQNTIYRKTIKSWPSPIDGNPIPMEIILGTVPTKKEGV